jgi:hypothetical protein
MAEEEDDVDVGRKENFKRKRTRRKGKKGKRAVRGIRRKETTKSTHLFAVGIEESVEVDYIWMGYHSHDLEFSVLKAIETRPMIEEQNKHQ